MDINKTMYKYDFLNPVLPLEKRVESLIIELTLSQKISLLHQTQPEIKHHKTGEVLLISFRAGGEALHGMSWHGEATVFPQATGFGATWNKALLKKIASAVSSEVRAFFKKNPETSGLNIWSPAIDLERDPRAGRFEEGYGEDPYFVGQMGIAYCEGLIGDHPFFYKTLPSVKHFYAYNQEFERDTVSVNIDDRNKYEYYLKPFKYTIESGFAKSMMTSYNLTNGIPCTIAPEINSLVRKKWAKDDFFIVTDAYAPDNLVTTQKYYQDHAKAHAGMIKAGIDSMTQDDGVSEKTVKYITQALNEGLLTEEELDKNVKNLLRARFHLGEFDTSEENPYTGIDENIICCGEHSKLALQSAKESIVLLKNTNNILPLDKSKNQKIAVIGPLSDIVMTDWYCGTPPYRITSLEGIINKFTDSHITFVNSFDTVALKSRSNGKYVSCGNQGNEIITASSLIINKSSSFRLYDWGWGKQTLICEENSKYVSTKDDKTLAADKIEPGGWFVKETYLFEEQSDGSFAIKQTSGGKYLRVEDDDSLISNSDTITENEKFDVEIINNGLTEACNTALDSDIVLMFMGCSPMINSRETEDRSDIILPPLQSKIIKEVYKNNNKSILILTSQHPQALVWEKENLPAIIYTSHLGQEQGNAIADVLSGDYNPGGKLSSTWYNSINDLPPINVYDIIKGKRTYMYFDKIPLFPFGYGLSYTQFHYEDLKINKDNYKTDEVILIDIKVKNTGKREGDEIIQVYIKRLNPDFISPKQELKEFERITIKPDETKMINFKIPVSEINYWNSEIYDYDIYKGNYTLLVGSSSEDIRQEINFRIS